MSKTHHILVVLLAFGVVLLSAAGPASAALTHPYLFQIAGTPSGSFGPLPCAVTVDPASQDVYVADRASQAIDIFSSSGVYQSKISGEGRFNAACSIAIDDASGEVYVAESGNDVVEEFDSSGKYLGNLNASSTPSGSEKFGRGWVHVAVDQSTGDVYVADSYEHVIDKFDSSGKLLSALTGFSEPWGVAVDSSGDLYVYDNNGGAITKLNPSGSQVYQIASGLGVYYGNPLAVDGAGDLYAAAASSPTVEEFEPSGALLDHTSGFATPENSFGPGGLEGVAASANGDVYVLDTFHAVVDVFGPAVILPDSTTEEASEVGAATTATLNGQVAPAGGGSITGCHFEVIDDATYQANGGDFFSGAIDIPCEQLLPILNPTGVTAKVTGLAPDTGYHFRLVAANANGEEYGSDETFETGGAPTVSETSAANITKTAATLQAKVNPHAAATTYHFEYVSEKQFNEEAPGHGFDHATKTSESGSIGSDVSEHQVSVAIGGLSPETTYRFRVFARNLNAPGGIVGEEATFTTIASLSIDSESVSGVASTSATLEAQVNPLGNETTYYFEYGRTTGYEDAAVPAPPGVSLGSGEGDVGVSVHLQGLAGGTTYHYRVVASNVLRSEIVGPDRTFATQAAGTVVTQPDGRVWELVTPPNKQGAGFYGIGPEWGADIQAAADGGAITYAATAPIVPYPAGSRSIENEQVFSTRRAPGIWGTADVTTAHDEGASAGGTFSEYRLFSSDLSFGAVEPAGDTPLPPLPAGSEKTIYLREADGEYKALVTSENVPEGVNFGGNEENEPGVSFVSASPDFKHVVLKSTAALVSGAPSGGEEGLYGEGGALYEWAEGQLRLVSVLPGNKEAVAARLGYSGYRRGGDVRGAISDDGSRIVWQTGGSFFLRDMVKEETIGLGSGLEDEFDLANSEGSRIFLTNAGTLDVFEVTSGKDEPLAGKTTELSGDVKGVIGASEDGSYVYFVAGRSMYVDRYDEATKTWMPPTLIAALSAGDAPTWGWDSTGQAEHGQLEEDDVAGFAEWQVSGVHVGGKPDGV